MTPKDAARELELVARDLDLVVFRLERDAPATAEAGTEERRRVRRELELLQERIEALARALG